MKQNIQDLINLDESLFGILKAEVITGPEILRNLDSKQIENLLSAVSDSGSYLSFELMLYIILKMYKNSKIEDQLFMMIGSVPLFLKMCHMVYSINVSALINVVQKSIDHTQYFKEGSPKLSSYYYSLLVMNILRDGGPSCIDVPKYMLDNLKNMVIHLSDLNTIFTNYQGYGISHAAYLKQVTQSKLLPTQIFDDSSQNRSKKRPPLYTQEAEFETTLMNYTRFEEIGRLKNFPAYKIITMVYLQELNSILALEEESRILKIVDLKNNSYTYFIDLLKCTSSKKLTIQWFTYSYTTRTLMLATNQSMIFIFRLQISSSLNVKVDRYKILQVRVPENFKFVRALDALPYYICISDTNNIYVLRDLEQELKQLEPRGEDLEFRKLNKKWGILYTEAFCEIQINKWVVFSTLDRTLLVVDPQRESVVLTIETSSLTHSLAAPRYGQRLFCANLDNCFYEYKLSMFYNEQQLNRTVEGHISIVVSAALMEELNLLITADKVGCVKSWNLSDLKQVQSTKMRTGSKIKKVLKLGPRTFIVINSVMNFFGFEPTNNFFQVLNCKTEDLRDRERLRDKEKLIIPQIATVYDPIFQDQIYIASGKNITSLTASSGLQSFKYSIDNFLKSHRNNNITCFNFIKYPLHCMAIGLENGEIVIYPLYHEDISKIKIIDTLKAQKKSRKTRKGSRGFDPGEEYLQEGSQRITWIEIDHINLLMMACKLKVITLISYQFFDKIEVIASIKLGLTSLNIFYESLFLLGDNLSIIEASLNSSNSPELQKTDKKRMSLKYVDTEVKDETFIKDLNKRMKESIKYQN